MIPVAKKTNDSNGSVPVTTDPLAVNKFRVLHDVAVADRWMTFEELSRRYAHDAGAEYQQVINGLGQWLIPSYGEKEILTHCAVIYNNRLWSAPRPNHYCAIYSDITAQYGVLVDLSMVEEGFLTNNKRFVTQVQALQIAKSSGLLKVAKQRRDRRAPALKLVTPEDLW